MSNQWGSLHHCITHTISFRLAPSFYWNPTKTTNYPVQIVCAHVSVSYLLWARGLIKRHPKKFVLHPYTEKKCWRCASGSIKQRSSLCLYRPTRYISTGTLEVGSLTWNRVNLPSGTITWFDWFIITLWQSEKCRSSLPEQHIHTQKTNTQ